MAGPIRSSAMTGLEPARAAYTKDTEPSGGGSDLTRRSPRHEGRVLRDRGTTPAGSDNDGGTGLRRVPVDQCPELLTGLEVDPRFDGTFTQSPVLGLRPLRGGGAGGERCRSRAVRERTLSPWCSASAMLPNRVSTTSSARFSARAGRLGHLLDERRLRQGTAGAWVRLWPEGRRSGRRGAGASRHRTPPRARASHGGPTWDGTWSHGVALEPGSAQRRGPLPTGTDGLAAAPVTLAVTGWSRRSRRCSQRLIASGGKWRQSDAVAAATLGTIQGCAGTLIAGQCFARSPRPATRRARAAARGRQRHVARCAAAESAL